MPPITSFPVQKGMKNIDLTRIADGWIIWLYGRPGTDRTYLYLHDNGTLERVLERTDGSMEVMTLPNV